MKHKKWSILYPLAFGFIWIVMAFLTHSWKPAVIGGVFILATVLAVLLNPKEKKKEDETAENKCVVNTAEENKVVRFCEFGFWVESVSEVKTLLDYMQQAIDIAKERGYNITGVHIFGGVHELDTGYESFSAKDYSSFEEAKEQLPIDFAHEEAGLDGHWLNTLNFEFFTVDVVKNDITSTITFSRGRLSSNDELNEIYLNTNWNNH